MPPPPRLDSTEGPAYVLAPKPVSETDPTRRCRDHVRALCPQRRAAPAAGAGAVPTVGGEDRDLPLCRSPTPASPAGSGPTGSGPIARPASPFGSRRLREAGNLRNLELAAEQVADPSLPPRPEAYQGPVFMDSDIYKWLEAVLWEHAREPSPELLAEVETFSRGTGQGAGGRTGTSTASSRSPARTRTATATSRWATSSTASGTCFRRRSRPIE